jgi:hypothetical protein
MGGRDAVVVGGREGVLGRESVADVDDGTDGEELGGEGQPRVPAVEGDRGGQVPARAVPGHGDPVGFFTGQDDWVERQYLANNLATAHDPRVSPLRAADHADLAPAVIGIGHHDPLLAQNLASAAALQAAGVPTVLREYPTSSTATWHGRRLRQRRQGRRRALPRPAGDPRPDLIGTLRAGLHSGPAPSGTVPACAVPVTAPMTGG